MTWVHGTFLVTEHIHTLSHTLYNTSSTARCTTYAHATVQLECCVLVTDQYAHIANMMQQLVKNTSGSIWSTHTHMMYSCTHSSWGLDGFLWRSSNDLMMGHNIQVALYMCICSTCSSRYMYICMSKHLAHWEHADTVFMYWCPCPQEVLQNLL